MKTATDAQLLVFSFIVEYKRRNDYFPTLKEIGEFLNQSPKAVHDKINALSKKGYLSKVGVRAYKIHEV